MAWNHCFSSLCFSLQLHPAKGTLAQSVSRSQTKNIVRKLKKIETQIKYIRPLKKDAKTLNLVVFLDASRTEDYHQIEVICGQLIDDLRSNSIFHTISLSSHKSNRPLNSVLSSEILAAEEGTNEGMQVLAAYREMLDLDISQAAVVY